MARPKKQPRKYDVDKVVARGLEMLRMGYYPSRICGYLHKEFNVPFSDFNEIKELMVKELKARTDIITENAKEVQLERLHALLEDTITQGDLQMALKTLAEINKMLGVYEQKLKVESTTYQLDI